MIGLEEEEVVSSRGVAERIASERARFLEFVARRTGSREEAEEVLQAALLKSLEAGSALRDQERVVAWFYRLLRNALADRARKRSAETRAMAKLAAQSLEDPVSADAELESLTCACALRLLATLPEESAALLRRIELDDESVGDVARSLGVPSGTLAVRLHRARATLRSRLQACCGACDDCTCPK
jgi:RNA polymerase sigma-70 factor (ECF subfamily)